MKKLVFESLDDFSAAPEKEKKLDDKSYKITWDDQANLYAKLNEDASPEAIQLASWIAGTLGAFLTAGGIAVLQEKLKKTKSPKAQKLGQILAKIGKGAAEGARKGPSAFKANESLNEQADPGLAEIIAGSIAVLASAGALGVLQAKLNKSKNKKLRQFGNILNKLGKGAAEGTKKAPKSIGT